MKKIIRLTLISGIIMMSGQFCFGQSAGDESLARLKEGNKRYLSGSLKAKDFAGERKEQAAGQKPYAIVLTCSDSRVPPEVIFDEDLGDLFVVRVAGNVIDNATLGSIEYGAEHLHAPLLIVMGHSSCGAVKATLEGGHFTPAIKSIAAKIENAVKSAKKESTDKTVQLNSAISHNVDNQVKAALKQSKVLKELEHEGKLKIAEAIYDIQTGQVQFAQ
ncbi:MAG: carbonic anhydrase [Syntrophothermus sp.]